MSHIIWLINPYWKILETKSKARFLENPETKADIEWSGFCFQKLRSSDGLTKWRWSTKLKSEFKVKGQDIDGEIKHGAPVFIILTDGEARDKDKRKEEVIQKYRSMSRMQIAVGVGSSFNRDELERISILIRAPYNL